MISSTLCAEVVLIEGKKIKLKYLWNFLGSNEESCWEEFCVCKTGKETISCQNNTIFSLLQVQIWRFVSLRWDLYNG